MKQNHAIKILSAIAHDGRLLLMRRLIQAGPNGVSAGALAQFAKSEATTTSAQLLVLSNAGLVRSVRKGRTVTYFAEYQAMSSLLSYLMVDCCGGNEDICSPAIKACC